MYWLTWPWLALTIYTSFLLCFSAISTSKAPDSVTSGSDANISNSLTSLPCLWNLTKVVPPLWSIYYGNLHSDDHSHSCPRWFKTGWYLFFNLEIKICVTSSNKYKSPSTIYLIKPLLMLHLIITTLILFSSDFDIFSNTLPSPTDSSNLDTWFFPTGDSAILSHINSSKYTAEQNYMNE